MASSVLVERSPWLVHFDRYIVAIALGILGLMVSRPMAPGTMQPVPPGTERSYAASTTLL